MRMRKTWTKEMTNEITPNYATCAHVFYSSHICFKVSTNSNPALSRPVKPN
jgi:hypothetical protein